MATCRWEISTAGGYLITLSTSCIQESQELTYPAKINPATNEMVMLDMESHIESVTLFEGNHEAPAINIQSITKELKGDLYENCVCVDFNWDSKLGTMNFSNGYYNHNVNVCISKNTGEMVFEEVYVI